MKPQWQEVSLLGVPPGSEVVEVFIVDAAGMTHAGDHEGWHEAQDVMTGMYPARMREVVAEMAAEGEEGGWDLTDPDPEERAAWVQYAEREAIIRCGLETFWRLRRPDGELVLVRMGVEFPAPPEWDELPPEAKGFLA